MKVKNVIINKNKVNNLENSVIKTGNVVNEYISSFNMQIFNEDYGENENMSSIITLFNINDYHILLMGDAPVERERWLIRDHELNIDIIRLGHHGSRTSSDYAFLKEIGAKEAIISSGRNNRFNHPHREVVANLEALNIIYYNTQTSGTIKYTFRRNNYLIRQYLP